MERDNDGATPVHFAAARGEWFNMFGYQIVVKRVH